MKLLSLLSILLNCCVVETLLYQEEFSKFDRTNKDKIMLEELLEREKKARTYYMDRVLNEAKRENQLCEKQAKVLNISERVVVIRQNGRKEAESWGPVKSFYTLSDSTQYFSVKCLSKVVVLLCDNELTYSIYSPKMTDDFADYESSSYLITLSR